MISFLWRLTPDPGDYVVRVREETLDNYELIFDSFYFDLHLAFSK